MVRSITELQGEDVINGPVCIHGVGVLVVTHISMLTPQDYYGSVDQLQHQLLILS